MGRDVEEYTGTHDYLRYPDANNNLAPIFLYNANGKQVKHWLTIFYFNFLGSWDCPIAGEGKCGNSLNNCQNAGGKRMRM
jgi:hypothetical protein